jgi:hypothetical protein
MTVEQVAAPAGCVAPAVPADAPKLSQRDAKDKEVYLSDSCLFPEVVQNRPILLTFYVYSLIQEPSLVDTFHSAVPAAKHGA